MGLMYKKCEYCGKNVRPIDSIKQGRKWIHTSCATAAEVEKRQIAREEEAEKRQAKKEKKDAKRQARAERGEKVGAAALLLAAAEHGRAAMERRQQASAQTGLAPTDEPEVASPAAAQPESLSIEQRLTRLKALHEQGLISQDDFEAQKQAILSEL